MFQLQVHNLQENAILRLAIAPEDDIRSYETLSSKT